MKIILIVGEIMSLCKGKVKIGRKNIKRGSNKFFFKRYLKKNYDFTVSEFKDRNKFEILEPVNVEGLDFFVDVEFKGIRPKEIDLRSIDNLEKYQFEKYENWVSNNLGLSLENSKWKNKKFNWGSLSVKLSKIRKEDLGCITIKIIYK
ncbi:hypothetical protein P6P39_10725 [Clostridium perfringens]|nr:hypothetical protein [Clostridium perfringens]